MKWAGKFLSSPSLPLSWFFCVLLLIVFPENSMVSICGQVHLRATLVGDPATTGVGTQTAVLAGQRTDSYASLAASVVCATG